MQDAVVPVPQPSLGQQPMLWQRQSYGAILFDCDGTLADTMPAHFVAWSHVTRLHGLQFDETRFYALGGRPSRDILALLAGEVGLELDLDAAVTLKENTFLDQLHEVRAIDPVVDVARRSSGRIPMAVVTGGHQHVCRRILTHLGIEHCFDTIVASEDTTRHKPEPEPFLEAASRLGVDPQSCVVWEDSDLGIEAARRAGMAWIDVRSFHTPRRLTT
jgi:HAD superfamily hydrolase (TIGR01509 family)